jgi:hypothetical protein
VILSLGLMLIPYEARLQPMAATPVRAKLASRRTAADTSAVMNAGPAR